MQWDATRLPLADASVDKVAMNMPYGKDIAIDQDAYAMVRAVLKEAARVTRPSGKIVALSVHADAVRQYTKRRRGLVVERELTMQLSGFTPTLFVLGRR